MKPRKLTFVSFIKFGSRIDDYQYIKYAIKKNSIHYKIISPGVTNQEEEENITHMITKSYNFKHHIISQLLFTIQAIKYLNIISGNELIVVSNYKYAFIFRIIFPVII